jgi:hypothetical protein
LPDDGKDPEFYFQWKVQIREVVGSGTLPTNMYNMIGQKGKENRCMCTQNKQGSKDTIYFHFESH